MLKLDINCSASAVKIPCQAFNGIERVVSEDLDFPLPGAERRRVDMSHMTLYMLGHAHIDLGYRWDYAETIHRIAPWTFKGILNLMDCVEGVTFCQSQAFLYQAMEREYPELFERIRERIRLGQWEFIGCSWCEYDAMLTGGESIIRQHLQALRYAEEKLGVKDHRVAFFPDSFCGHAATLPQILSGCGFRYYLMGRGLPPDPEQPDSPRRVFVWQGRDGSSLTAFFTFGPYSTPPLDEKQLADLLPYIKSGVDRRELVLYGIGDHGGGPRQEDINALRALNSAPQAPQWRFAMATQYFDLVYAGPDAPKLRIFRGNLPKGMSGALTSQAGVKRQNRLLERLLCATESLSAIGSLLQRKPAYPRVDFQKLWREFLTHQFHDVLPGTSVASVYRDVNHSYGRIRSCLENLTRDALNRLAACLDTRDEGYALLVYNPSMSEVCAMVEAPLPPALQKTPPFPLLLDSDGDPVEAIVTEGSLKFKAAVSPLGYEIFRLRPEISGSGQTFAAPRLNKASLETDRYMLNFDPLTGDILSISAHNGKAQLLRGPSNTLMLFNEDEQATSWIEVMRDRRQDVRLVQPPTVVEHTPFFTRIRTVSKTAWSTFTREITVYRDIGRLDFRLFVDWFESNAFLKIGIAPAIENAGVTTSIPFGSIAVENPSNEFAIREWVLLRSPSSAAAVFNDGCHGADFKNGALGLSVVRNARDMDPAMDHGRHELRYALLPLPGNVTESELVREQENFLAAFLLKWESPHPGPIRAWGEGMMPALPAKGCFLKAQPGNVVVCAFKLPEEDWTPQSFVVRVRETDGLATDAVVTMPVPISSAARTDHLERRGDQDMESSGDKVKLRLKPYEIATFIAARD